MGEIAGEHPIIEGKCCIIFANVFFYVVALSLGKNNFSGTQALYELEDIGLVAVGAEKLAGTDIQKRRADKCLRCKYCTKKIILLPFEDIVIERKARRHQLCHAALHNAFYKSWIFQLIA